MASFVASSSALQRLSWLASQYKAGRPIRVGTSYNSINRSEKFTFHLEPWTNDAIESVHRPVLGHIIETLKCAIPDSITTDKGHCASSGCSVVQFWLKPAPSSPSVPPPPMLIEPLVSSEDELPPVPPPMQEMDVVLDKLNIIEQQTATISSLAHQVSAQDLISAQNNTIHRLTEHVAAQEAMCQASINQFRLLDQKLLDHIGIGCELHAMRSGMDDIIERVSRLDSCCRTIEKSFGVKSETPKVDVGIQAPILQMKRYCFRRIHAASMPSVRSRIDRIECRTDVGIQVCPVVRKLGIQTDQLVANDAQTQVTARIFHDEMDRLLSTACESHSEHPDSGNCSEAPESESEDEELISLSESQCKKDCLYRRKVRVVQGGEAFYGRIINISVTVVTGQNIYHVAYDDGDAQDFTRDEITKWLL